MAFEIVPLSYEHLERISVMHIRYLHSPFLGKAGEQMLQAYYSVLAIQKGGCGYLALNGSQIAGYICGVWDPNEVKSYLFIIKWKSLLGVSFGLLFKSPKVIIALVSRIFGSFRKKTDKSLEGYELRPIVVDEAFRGTQVASLLVAALAMDARKRGYSSMFLLTEVDNIPANKFYQKQGFENKGIIVRSKQEYIYYSLIL